ncbi:hypothetical protein [Caulobacter sp. SLTY]|uniref:hypothetical protein n=1 Tax=Caulobacter sp. SLTY TaxID=2683262 RepID=UPI0014126EFC|nr:hypothetical protein [Caulobacter sp. SLTY]
MSSFLKIFGWPTVLAILSLIGLVGALVGDGPWDWLSWLCLGFPLAVLGWVLKTRRS